MLTIGILYKKMTEKKQLQHYLPVALQYRYISAFEQLILWIMYLRFFPNSQIYKNAGCLYSIYKWHYTSTRCPHLYLIITCDSEVIIFSPCVCLCMCLSVYVCHDVCRDDLTMKDWCHTNNILQVHCWGCLIVQVIIHSFMTSLRTWPGHKVSKILKLIHLRQYLS